MNVLRVFVLSACLSWGGAADPVKQAFDSAEAGRLPSGWSQQAGEWKTVDIGTGKALSQVASQHTGRHFNLVLLDQGRWRDLHLRVKIRAVAGNEDQGGGLVWRRRSPDDYYVCRINPLEGNYRVYKVVAGQRIQIGSAEVGVSKGRWYGLDVSMRGDHIECSLDGKKLLDAHDTTLTEPGQVGLWTKADAQTQFDDLQVEDL